MPERWPLATFGSLYAQPSRNAVSYPTRLRGAGVPMVNMRELFAFDRIRNQDMELVPLTEKERGERLLEEGDLLFARQSLVREGAGRVVYVEAGPPRTWEGHVIRVRLDRARADPRYFYYFFRSPLGRSSIEAIVEQVAAAGIRGSDLSTMRVPVPSLPEQRATAEVLGALDDKIEANRREQEAAESLARAELARAQEHAETAVRIGTLVGRVSDIIKAEELTEDDVYVGLEHMPRGSLLLKEHGTTQGVASAKAIFQPNDVLFGKLRPYFKKVVIAPSAGVCSTDILVLRPKEGDWALAAAVCASDEVIDYATAGSEGTRMPRVSWDYLSRYEVRLPASAGRRKLQERMAPLLDFGMQLTAESRILANLRDTLLPKLLSGELRVRDAESLVETTP